MNELAWMSAYEMGEKIRKKELSPVEATGFFLDRIEKTHDALNAVILVLRDEAMAKAREAEAAVMAGKVGGALGKLHGVPLVIKDLFDMKAGVVNSFGSRVFKDYVPDVDATYVGRMEAAGGIVLGKTNTPEFGHKGTTDNRLYGATCNPFDLSKNPGGSSGGTAAVVASGVVPFGQGSDGGGSIRIPAAWCNLVGVKATYGRVAAAARPNAFISHTPFIHAGPLARTVKDAAMLLEVMCGQEDTDPLSSPTGDVDFVSAVDRGVEGMRIAYSADFGAFEVDAEVGRVVKEAMGAFEEAGAKVEEVEMDMGVSQDELSDMWVRQIGVIYAEIAASFMGMGIDLLGDLRGEICDEFAEMIELGNSMSAVEYRSLDWKRTLVYDGIQGVLNDYDLLVTPTLSAMPVANESEGQTLGPAEVNGRGVERCIGWCMTHPLNFTGHPATSVPAGMSGDGLPVGLQIIGRRFDDHAVFAGAGALERFRPWAGFYDQIASELKV